MLRSYSNLDCINIFIIKVSLLRRFIFNRVVAPEGELLSFASPKESNQRKGDPVTAYFLRSSLLSRVSRRGSCPSADARHPCRAPNGLFSIKAPVLGAANGRNTIRA